MHKKTVNNFTNLKQVIPRHLYIYMIYFSYLS